MPRTIEASNRSKHFHVRQMSKSHNRINCIVSFIFNDRFKGSLSYSHRILSLSASLFRVASSEKKTGHLVVYCCRISTRARGQELPRIRRKESEFRASFAGIAPTRQCAEGAIMALNARAALFSPQLAAALQRPPRARDRGGL